MCWSGLTCYLPCERPAAAPVAAVVGAVVAVVVAAAGAVAAAADVAVVAAAAAGVVCWRRLLAAAVGTLFAGSTGWTGFHGAAEGPGGTVFVAGPALAVWLRPETEPAAPAAEAAAGRC